MGIFRSPVCLWRSLWRSLRVGALVSGHDYRMTEEGTVNVDILVCDTCGHQSIGWREP